jgi:hypothetical protein
MTAAIVRDVRNSSSEKAPYPSRCRDQLLSATLPLSKPLLLVARSDCIRQGAAARAEHTHRHHSHAAATATAATGRAGAIRLLLLMTRGIWLLLRLMLPRGVQSAKDLGEERGG